MSLNGMLVPQSAVVQLVMPPSWCTCVPAHFPDMLDADCPLHGLRAIIEGRFNFDEHVRA